jgi:ketosteroid isomerase-like protein
MNAEAMIKRAYDEAWNSGDLEGMLELAHEEIVLRPSGRIVDLEREYRGHEGVRRFWNDLRAPWNELAMDVDRVVENGDKILVLFRFQAKGRDGLELDAKFGQVGTLRDGLVHTLTAYPDWESAAEAAGVEL